MWIKDFVKYYKTPKEKRKELLNVLSLEFSLTAMEKSVKAPAIVKEIDWVERYWPKILRGDTDRGTGVEQTDVNFPKVQNYCLMSVEGCYTDFHVDFGGTSVWYHVFKGEKVFWMIPPTETNIKLYEEWTLSGIHQDQVFFGDVVEKCHRATLKAGNTFFIPAGWIHAVYTPTDSLVFGGNFLHNYAISTQLWIYDLEKRTHVGKKFRYPYFVPILWYVAAGLVLDMSGRQYVSEEEIERQLSSGRRTTDMDSVDSEESNLGLETRGLEECSKPAGESQTEQKEALEKQDSKEGAKWERYSRPPTAYEWREDKMRALCNYEVDGLEQLAKWLSSLPPEKQQVPYGISRPEYLLRDLKTTGKKSQRDFCRFLVMELITLTNSKHAAYYNVGLATMTRPVVCDELLKKKDDFSEAQEVENIIESQGNSMDEIIQAVISEANKIRASGTISPTDQKVAGKRKKKSGVADFSVVNTSVGEQEKELLCPRNDPINCT